MPHLNVDLNYENHLEMQLIKNKEPPPKSDLGIVLTVGITLTIAITLGLSLITDPEQSAPLIDSYRIPTPTPSNRREIAREEDSNAQLKDLQPGNRVRINQCTGEDDYAGANFRDYPALTPLTIRGVVPEGEWVTLTGETTNADGIVWYRVMNEFALERSEEINAQNKTSANQTGWIANCFIEE